ncbi:MAG: hypothetical protein QW279_15200, partial [Candidatus Jordarchaeaceae archaeon]
MRRVVFLISLLICLMVASSVIIFQTSPPAAFGAVQGLQTGSKFVYGPFYNLSSSNPIQIPIPSGWDVTSINITFSNIRAPNSTILMEDLAFRANDVTNVTRAMSFQLPENQTAYLYSTGLYLLHFPFEAPNLPIELNISLYNATSTEVNGKVVPIPHVLLNNETFRFPLLTGPIGWKDFFSENSYELDPEINTFNNTFFIALTNASALPPAPPPFVGTYRVFWFFAPDNGTETEGNITYEDSGYAFYYNDATSSWVPEYADTTNPTITVDFCLKVRLSVSNESGYWQVPFPTGVNMNVNGTAVQNISRGEGLCNLSQPLNMSENLANMYIETSWLSP